MDYKERYLTWLNDESIYSADKKELQEISDEKELEDRFYQDLEFGTAGLRGKLGMGANRMNCYNIARATYAFAKVIQSFGEEFAKKGVAIAFDCRLFSNEFALETALVLAGCGIKSYLYKTLRSTPQLSYTVRYFQCAGGINITASHNPKDYNGYKVYWEEGSQIKSDIADLILAEIEKIKSFGEIPRMSEEEAIEKSLLQYIGEEVDRKFLDNVLQESLRDEDVDKSIRIVYTPLNGTGNIPVRKVLQERGFTNIFVVREQENPDGTFSTIEYPNPEDIKAFEYSIQLAQEKNADLLIATDPDCDRLAVMVKDENSKTGYTDLTGNQTGVLLVYYILSTLKEKNQMPQNPIIVKSIVTGEMSSAICKDFGVEMISVLTGFKNICALSNLYETTQEKTYIMGYEESIGYNIGTFVRDKDGVCASMMLAEAAGYFKSQGKTLLQVLEELFKKYGYYKENTTSLVLEGLEGQKRIGRMMVQYRKNFPRQINSLMLSTAKDYKTSTATDIQTGTTSTIDVEKTDCLSYRFSDGSWYALRPSGTEPKIKLYVYSVDSNREGSEQKLQSIKNKVLKELQKI